MTAAVVVTETVEKSGPSQMDPQAVKLKTTQSGSVEYTYHSNA